MSTDTFGGDGRALSDAAAGFGLTVSPRQIDQLLHYRDALLKWNKVYNLTSIREPSEVLWQHLIDCMAVVPPLQRQLSSISPESADQSSLDADRLSAMKILDVGSGGGLPGVVVAVLLPELQVDCVDAVGKKSAFVRQVGGELGLARLAALHARVEDLQASEASAGYDLITSRAFASLADFVRLTRHLLKPKGVWAAMKASVSSEEQAELDSEPIDLFHVEPLSLPGHSQKRCIVWMRPTTPNNP